jgi:hypothetical protein
MTQSGSLCVLRPPCRLGFQCQPSISFPSRIHPFDFSGFPTRLPGADLEMAGQQFWKTALRGMSVAWAWTTLRRS